MNFSRSLLEGEKKFCWTKREERSWVEKEGKTMETGQERTTQLQKRRELMSLIFVNIPWLFRSGLIRVTGDDKERTVGPLMDDLEPRQIVEDGDHCSLIISEGFRIFGHSILHLMTFISIGVCREYTIRVTSLACRAAVRINEMGYVKLLERMVLCKQ